MAKLVKVQNKSCKAEKAQGKTFVGHSTRSAFD